MVTVKSTLAALRALGVRASYKEGEYRITLAGESAAYYTTDAEDALDTAKVMVASA
jgi:hypothetical protein